MPRMDCGAQMRASVVCFRVPCLVPVAWNGSCALLRRVRIRCFLQSGGTVMGSVREAWAAVAAAAGEVRDRGLTSVLEAPVIISRIAGSPDRRIAGSPDRRIAGSPDRRIAGSPDRRIAGSRSPDRRSPDRRIAGSPHLRARSGHDRGRMAAAPPSDTLSILPA